MPGVNSGGPLPGTNSGGPMPGGNYDGNHLLPGSSSGGQLLTNSGDMRYSTSGYSSSAGGGSNFVTPGDMMDPSGGVMEQTPMSSTSQVCHYQTLSTNFREN